MTLHFVTFTKDILDILDILGDRHTGYTLDITSNYQKKFGKPM